MSRIRFHHFAWGLLLYTLPAIVWGAYVRASHSVTVAARTGRCATGKLSPK
jgi:hypothetical protein